MKGMISKESLAIQAECVDLGSCSLSLDNWVKGLAINLLEATHGKWPYRNMLVHDTASGLKAAERKEELQRHQFLMIVSKLCYIISQKLN